jgi:hypothetical protein
MFAMEHCSHKDWWINYDPHRDAPMLRALASRQAARRARTIWVKVKAHASIPLNERADCLAGMAGECEEDPTVHCAPTMNLVQQEAKESIKFMTLLECGEEAEIPSKQLGIQLINVRNNRICAKPTKTESYMRAPNVSRDLYSKILWASGQHQLPDTTVKRNLQILSNTFPTTRRLHVIGIEATDICPYCTSNVPETTTHWQSECPCFSEARTLVHNNIWTAIWHELTDATRREGWVGYRETRIIDTEMKYTVAASANRQPDGILHQPSTNTWILYDFTRTSGYTVEDMQSAREGKESSYAQLLEDLRTSQPEGHRVLFFPIVSSYTGAIDTAGWTKAMQKPFAKMTPKCLTKILRAGITQLLLGTDTMATARIKAPKVQDPVQRRPPGAP